MANPTNVFSALRPEWILDTEGVGYDNEFWCIVDFFLLHSLCDGQSWKNNNLHDTYLWKRYPWQSASYLKDKITRAIWGGDIPRLYMAETRALLQNKINGRDLDDDFYMNVHLQRAGYVKTSKGKNNDNIIMSLFYHIRNALAHGRYGFVPVLDNDYMIFLEDGDAHADTFEVTARIAITKRSLLAIRDVIINGPEEEPDYSLEVIESIRRGCNTKSQIITDLDISEKEWDKTTTRLKAEGRIRYTNNRKWELL